MKITLEFGSLEELHEWEQKIVADAAKAPQSAAPQPTAPQSAAPQSAAPQSAAPQPTAPQSAAPQSAAPQSAAPQSAAPQSAAPQSAAPQEPPKKRGRGRPRKTKQEPTVPLNSGCTVDDLRRKLIEVREHNDGDPGPALQILQQIGGLSGGLLTELPEEKYSAVMAALQEVLDAIKQTSGDQAAPTDPFAL